MKAGWKTVKLNDVTELLADGDWIESKDQSDDGIRLIQTGNIGDGIFKDREEKARYISESTFKRLRCTEIFEGDCLVSRLPEPVGRSCILPRIPRSITAVDCSIIRFKRTAILPEYFCYYSQSREYQRSVESKTSGTTRKRISRSHLSDIEIPLPPLAEQKRIVALLDAGFAGIDEAKANAEANRKDANQLFRSHTQSIFTQSIDGWPTKKLGDICDFEGGSQPPKSKFVYSQKSGYVRFLQIRDFSSDKFITFIPESKKNRHCKEHDILIARYGASVGKILTGKAGAYNVALMKTLPNLTQLDRDFFHQYLTSGAFQDQLVKVAARTAQNGFSKEDIHDFPVPVPPLEEQRRVINQISPLSELCQNLSTTYGRKQTILSDLKQSLLSRAFAGELTA